MTGAGAGAIVSQLDPAARAIPDVRRPDGRGVFLIESLMDEVSVSSGAGGTVVRMVRHLAETVASVPGTPHSRRLRRCSPAAVG